MSTKYSVIFTLNYVFYIYLQKRGAEQIRREHFIDERGNKQETGGSSIVFIMSPVYIFVSFCCSDKGSV